MIPTLRTSGALQVPVQIESLQAGRDLDLKEAEVPRPFGCGHSFF